MKELKEILLYALDIESALEDDTYKLDDTLEHDDYGLIEFYRPAKAVSDFFGVRDFIGIIRADRTLPLDLEDNGDFHKDLDKIAEMGKETECEYFIQFKDLEHPVLIDRVYQEAS